MIHDDDYYMGLAIDEAKLAMAADEVPVGAVVVSNGKVIARGHNMTQRLNDVTAHAEMIAVTSASVWLGGKYLTGCTLYVTLEPCVMCAGALGWAQLERLVYGADDPRRGYSTTAPQSLHPKTEVTRGVKSDECTKMIVSYFKGKRGKGKS